MSCLLSILRNSVVALVNKKIIDKNFYAKRNAICFTMFNFCFKLLLVAIAHCLKNVY